MWKSLKVLIVLGLMGLTTSCAVPGQMHANAYNPNSGAYADQSENNNGVGQNALPNGLTQAQAEALAYNGELEGGILLAENSVDGSTPYKAGYAGIQQRRHGKCYNAYATGYNQGLAVCYQSPNTPNSGAMLPYGCTPMDANSFAQVLAMLKSEPFDDEKINILGPVLKSGANFTCEQVLAILNTYKFESKKEKVALKLYPHVCDKSSWFTVKSAFSFDSSWKVVVNSLPASNSNDADPLMQAYGECYNSYATGYNQGLRACNPYFGIPGTGHVTQSSCSPMDSSTFAQLLSMLNAEAFDDAKDNILTPALSSGVKLTTDQVQAILKSYNFESNKVSTAVKLYPRVCDQSSWFTLKSAFTFDSSWESVIGALDLK